MNPSIILNLAALTISVVALAVSGLLARQQSMMVRHGNELRILIDIVQDFRSRDFQMSEFYVLNELAAKNDPSLGLSNLPEAPRLAATYVTSFFNSLGALVYHQMVDEAIVVSQYGFRAGRAWNALVDHIDQERRIRNDPYYARPFEHLVHLVRHNWPPDARYRQKLKTVPRKEALAESVQTA